MARAVMVGVALVASAGAWAADTVGTRAPGVAPDASASSAAAASRDGAATSTAAAPARDGAATSAARAARDDAPASAAPAGSAGAASDAAAPVDWAARYGTQRGAVRREADLGQPGARSPALRPNGGSLTSHDYTRLYGGETATPPVGSTVSGPEMGPGNALR